MKKLPLKSLEKIMNATLSPEALKPLQHKMVVIHLKHPAISVYFLFLENKVVIEDCASNIIDVEIFTSLASIIRMKFQKKKSFIGNGFYIRGDMDVARTFNALFEHHSIDWEEHLSKLTGDIFAHKVGLLFRRKKSFVEDSSRALIDNVSEFLQEEITILPSPHAIRHFYDEVDELVMAVDRLAAKIALLEKKGSSNV